MMQGAAETRCRELVASRRLRQHAARCGAADAPVAYRAGPGGLHRSRGGADGMSNGAMPPDCLDYHSHEERHDALPWQLRGRQAPPNARHGPPPSPFALLTVAKRSP